MVGWFDNSTESDFLLKKPSKVLTRKVYLTNNENDNDLMRHYLQCYIVEHMHPLELL